MTQSGVALVLNSGSSSLKFAAFDMTTPQLPSIVAGQVDPAEGEAAFAAIDAALVKAGAGTPVAVGHRIVHGGPRLLRHCFINQGVTAELKQAEIFAPLHVPAALALVETARRRYPRLPQIACFDTAFHAAMPDVARTLPIPGSLRAAGLRRYGFHGVSCESILHQLGNDIPPRLVIAHLGNGASVTAVRTGRSVDTSMGLTPSGGVMMGTRTGDIDPGVLIHVLRTKEYGPEALEKLVDAESGLLGVSGLSSDMRTLHKVPGAGPDLAIRMFCRSVSKQIAAMMVVLGGADMIVFTGGIGEHDEGIRDRICADLGWAGIRYQRPGDSVRTGECVAITLPSCEEEQIARHMRAMLATA